MFKQKKKIEILEKELDNKDAQYKRLEARFKTLKEDLEDKLRHEKLERLEDIKQIEELKEVITSQGLKINQLEMDLGVEKIKNDDLKDSLASTEKAYKELKKLDIKYITKVLDEVRG